MGIGNRLMPREVNIDMPKGKPSKGTKADKRLKRNRKKKSK